MYYLTTFKKCTKLYKIVGVFIFVALSVSCSVSQVHEGPSLPKNARWVMLPIINFALTPQAGVRTEAILATHLRSIGLVNIVNYPYQTQKSGLPDLNEQHRYETALKAVKKLNYEYAITGSIDEWRYKSGLDGEPAVGVSLKVIDMKTDKVVWSVSGSRTGWGYESVTGTVNKLLAKLLGNLKLE